MVEYRRSLVSREVRPTAVLLLTVLGVTDLTFHNMSFLKQSRREPQKPLSRRRELEDKRGEREREEISAFFLRKSLPERSDMQGRRRPGVSELSCHSDRAGDNPTHTHERLHALNQPRLLPESDNHLTQIHEQTPREEKKESKASTYMTWSTSRASPGLRKPSVSHTRALSSTPVRVREALARSGIFDNTGIAYGNSHTCEEHQIGASPKGGLASASSPPMGQTSEQAAQPVLDQPVRIVRYQDRGTMAEQRSRDLENHSRQSSMQDGHATAQAEPFDATRQERPVDMAASAQVSMSEVMTKPCKMINTTNTGSRDANMVDQAINPDEGMFCSEAGPKRPKSPKWAVVERLEAAAEGMRPAYSAPALSTVAQTDRQPSQLVASNSFPRSFNSHVASPKSRLYAPTSSHDADWMVSGPILRPGQRSRTPLELSTSLLSTKLGVLPDKISAHYGVSQSQYPAVTHYLDQIASILPTEAPPGLVTAYTASPRGGHVHGAQQSLQDYIAEIERDMLDQPEAGESSSKLSWKETHTTRDSNLAELDADVEHESGDAPTFVGGNGPPLDRAPSSASHHKWAAVAGLLEEDEEQRFMSSFWRPNRYPI